MSVDDKGFNNKEIYDTNSNDSKKDQLDNKDNKKTFIKEMYDKETGFTTIHKSHRISNRQIYINYVLLFIAHCVFNMSVSGFASITDTLIEELKVEEAAIGFLATMNYIGCVCGACVYYLIINLNLRKSLILSTLTGKIICLLIFVLTNSYNVSLIFRFLEGFFLVFYSIYIPVWIDQYVPKNRKTILMSCHHLESMLGTILGFLLTTLMSKNKWRISFIVQAILEFICLIFFLFVRGIFFSRTIKRVGDSEIFVIETVVAPCEDKIKESETYFYNNKENQSESIESSSRMSEEVNSQNALNILNKDETKTIETLIETPEQNIRMIRKVSNIVAMKIDSGFNNEVAIKKNYLHIFIQLVTNKVIL